MRILNTWLREYNRWTVSQGRRWWYFSCSENRPYYSKLLME